jgi:hypothetical protein
VHSQLLLLQAGYVLAVPVCLHDRRQQVPIGRTLCRKAMHTFSSLRSSELAAGFSPTTMARSCCCFGALRCCCACCWVSEGALLGAPAASAVAGSAVAAAALRNWCLLLGWARCSAGATHLWSEATKAAGRRQDGKRSMAYATIRVAAISLMWRSRLAGAL